MRAFHPLNRPQLLLDQCTTTNFVECLQHLRGVSLRTCKFVQLVLQRVKSCNLVFQFLVHAQRAFLFVWSGCRERVCATYACCALPIPQGTVLVDHKALTQCVVFHISVIGKYPNHVSVVHHTILAAHGLAEKSVKLYVWFRNLLPGFGANVHASICHEFFVARRWYHQHPQGLAIFTASSVYLQY